MNTHKLKINWMIAKYRFAHWLFAWNQDEDGDIVFSIANTVHFIKYKEHTIVKFGNQSFDRAGKWQGAK